MWQPVRLDPQRHAARLRHPHRMTQQSESGHIGGTLQLVFLHHGGTALVQQLHLIQRSLYGRLLRHPVPLSGKDHTRTQWLGQYQYISGPYAGIGNQLIRMHGTHHRQSEFGRIIFDGVTTEHQCSRLHHLVVTTLQDGAKHIQRDFGRGEHHQVQHQQRRSAHRVDIAQRIGCRDLPKLIPTAAHWREEIGGENQGRLIVQPVHTGIVVRLDTYHQIGVRDHGQLGQDLSQLHRR